MKEGDLSQIYEISRSIKEMIEETAVNGRINYDVLHEVYQNNTDRYIEEAKEPLACKERCSYCCWLTVEMPEGEMDYIMNKYLDERGEEAAYEILRKAKRRLRKTGDMSREEREATRLPCPFLVEHRCSIYKYRPLSCRSMNVTEVEPCIKSFNGQDTETGFHAGPKVLAGLFAIAIESYLTGKDLMFVIANQENTWGFMEKEIVKIYYEEEDIT